MNYTFDDTMKKYGEKRFVQVKGEDGTFFDYVFVTDLDNHIKMLVDGEYEAHEHRPGDGLVPPCKIRDFNQGAMTYTDATYEGGTKFYHSRFDMCAQNYGTVEHDEITLALCEQAYSSNYLNGIAYFATAIDELENEYKVRWNTTEEWDEACEAASDDPDGCYPILNDESEACDWDNPAEITPV